MSASELIASLVDSLAWPLAVVAVVFVFRGAIANLIRTVTQLRYGSFEVNFGRELAALEAQAPAALPPPAAPDVRGIPHPGEEIDRESIDRRRMAPEPSRLPEEKVATVAQVSPAAAVSLAWNEIETELRDAAQRTGSAPAAASQDTEQLMQTLAAAGTMSPDVFGYLDRMRRLRNEAVHAPPQALTPAEAQDYARLANQVIQHIKTQT
jgi:hypothetical protein